MVGIPFSCRICNSVKNPTNPISAFKPAEPGNFPIEIKEVEGDTEGNNICHSCTFEIILLDEVAGKYKNILPITNDLRCYLCAKENIRFQVSEELYDPIRVIEETLTIKNILPRNIEAAVWNRTKKSVRGRKICCECYFLIDTANEVLQRLKNIDPDAKRAFIHVKSMPPIESDDESEEEESDSDFEDENPLSVNEDESMSDDENISDDFEDMDESNESDECIYSNDEDEDIDDVTFDDCLDGADDKESTCNNGLLTPLKDDDKDNDSEISSLSDYEGSDIS